MKFLRLIVFTFISSSVFSFTPMNLLASELSQTPSQNPAEKTLFHCLVGSGMSGITFDLIETQNSTGNSSILIKENDHPQTGSNPSVIVGTLSNPMVHETSTTFSAYSVTEFGQMSGLIFAEKSLSSDLWFIVAYIVNDDRSTNDFKNLMNVFGCNKLF